MSATFSITTKGALAIQRRLGALVEAFGDLTPLMEGFGVTLEAATLDRFDREEAPSGLAWEKSQRAIDEGGKTLTDTGMLRQSVHSVASGNKVEVGTNKIYAGIHQFGFSGSVTVGKHTRTIDRAFGKALKQPVTFEVDAFERLVNMPARPYLGLSAEDETELLAQAEDYARDTAPGAFA